MRISVLDSWRAKGKETCVSGTKKSKRQVKEETRGAKMTFSGFDEDRNAIPARVIDMSYGGAEGGTP